MVGGQVEDLAWENKSRLGTSKVRSIEALEHIHACKTGALFRACLRLGSWVAQGELPGGPDAEILNCLDCFGRCFGMVFQITDDLIDVEGKTQNTGKRVNKDAERGKLTYPSFLGVEDSRRQARRLAQEGQEHLRPLGPSGQRLAELLGFVLDRDR
jgi:geranylgeranyl diphosphate synthase type II